VVALPLTLGEALALADARALGVPEDLAVPVAAGGCAVLCRFDRDTSA
jgi:hypothetical protein